MGIFYDLALGGGENDDPDINYDQGGDLVRPSTGDVQWDAVPRGQDAGRHHDADEDEDFDDNDDEILYDDDDDRDDNDDDDDVKQDAVPGCQNAGWNHHDADEDHKGDDDNWYIIYDDDGDDDDQKDDNDAETLLPVAKMQVNIIRMRKTLDCPKSS